MSDDEILRLQEEWEKIRYRGRLPQAMSDLVSKLMARKGYGQLAAHEALNEHWETIVGKRLGKHSRVVHVSRGTVQILVENSAVLQELVFQKKKILTKLKQAFTKQEIVEVKFRIGAID